MQGIYTHIPETNYVPREYSVAAILLLLFMVLISLVSVLNLLYFYISTFRSITIITIIIIIHLYARYLQLQIPNKVCLYGTMSQLSCPYESCYLITINGAEWKFQRLWFV